MDQCFVTRTARNSAVQSEGGEGEDMMEHASLPLVLSPIDKDYP